MLTISREKASNVDRWKRETCVLSYTAKKLESESSVDLHVHQCPGRNLGRARSVNILVFPSPAQPDTCWHLSVFLLLTLDTFYKSIRPLKMTSRIFLTSWTLSKLFLKLNWVICKKRSVLPVHCSTPDWFKKTRYNITTVQLSFTTKGENRPLATDEAVNKFEQ
jgi:hypothetical protein